MTRTSSSSSSAFWAETGIAWRASCIKTVIQTNGQQLKGCIDSKLARLQMILLDNYLSSETVRDIMSIGPRIVRLCTIAHRPWLPCTILCDSTAIAQCRHRRAAIVRDHPAQCHIAREQTATVLLMHSSRHPHRSTNPAPCVRAHSLRPEGAGGGDFAAARFSLLMYVLRSTL